MKNTMYSEDNLPSSFKYLYHNKNLRLLPELQLTTESKEEILTSIPKEILGKLPEDIIQLLVEGIHYYDIYKEYRFTHEEYRQKNIFLTWNDNELIEMKTLEDDLFSFFRKELLLIGMTSDKITEKVMRYSWQYGPNGCFYALFEMNQPQFPYESFYDDSGPDHPYLYNSIGFSMSTGINYYSLSLWKYSLETKKHYPNYTGETDEEKKWVQGIEKIMTKIGYKRIDPELLRLVLPVQGELYSSIPTPEDGIDVSGEEASGPYILGHLLFGE